MIEERVAMTKTCKKLSLFWLSWTMLGIFASTAFGQSLPDLPIQGVGGSGAQQAVSSKSGGNQYMLGGTLMFFKNESRQSSQELPGGSTMYGQGNLQVNLVNYLCGIGLTYQQDKIGTSQTNLGIGAKAEFTWRGYYIEAGYGSASQSFVNRAVKSRTGTQAIYGFGIRVPFVSQFLYFDGGVRQRTAIYTTQDGVKMASPLTESILMPFIGAGISL